MLGKDILNNLSAYKQGMQIAEVKQKYNLEKIVKLASNENPYGYSKRVTETLRQMAKDFEIYPDGYAYDLRVALAEKLDVHQDQLVFGSGSDEVITFICRAFLSSGTNTVMATPTFSQYRHHALIEGASLREVPTVNGKHDLSGMIAAIDEKTKVVWLCSPDNPTGTLIKREEFTKFMNDCPSDVVVVLDEAYNEFVDEQLRLSMHETLQKYPNVIILRTFSKIYGLAGLRVGYGIASEQIAEKLNIVRGPFNTSSLAQRVVKAALEDDEFIFQTRKKNEQVKQSFQAFLDTVNWRYYESHTNFLLVKTPIDADEVSQYLLTHGFIVRSGNLLGYPQTVRITIGNKQDMEDLQKIISSLQKEINDGVFG